MLAYYLEKGGDKMPRRNPLCYLLPWLPFCRRPYRPHDRRHDHDHDHDDRHDDRHDERYDRRNDGRYN